MNKFMKKYYKLFVALLLISLIVPQITLAAWWNPFSWNIWKIFRPQTMTTTTPTNTNNIFTKTNTGVEETASPYYSKELEEYKMGVENAKVDAEKKANVAKIEEESRIRVEQQKLQNQQVQSAPLNSILCNGRYWTDCPSGQKFFCPATGDAQCLIENTQTPVGSFSGLEKINYCSESAKEQYEKAKAEAEADKRKCEEEGQSSLVCFIRGSTAFSISSYFSACLGNSSISNNQPTYSPQFTAPSNNINNYSPPAVTPLFPALPDIPSLSETIRARKQCEFFGGFYLGGKCY